jgi:hypothetical protein
MEKKPPTEAALFFGGRLPPFPKRVSGFIVTAAAAEEHQRHKSAPDEE